LGRRVSRAKRLEAPFPLFRHGGLADLPGLKDNVLLAERKPGDLGRITRAIHLAHLVGAALERKHPARNEGADDVVGAEAGVLHLLFHEAYDPVCLVVRLLRIIAPVSFGG
jgi:hypothetical protein